jgi:outer membrane receptor protein involved in Fe transport
MIILAAALLAAAPAEADDDLLEHVIVTATRRSTDMTEVAAAISTVDSETVISHKLATDALQSLPGVYLQQTTPGQGAAIVRGLKGSAILHLVDGMRLSNAMFRTAPTPWFALVPATSVERLEIIRGTPASLYGSEAVGGVVQSVSRLPEFDSEEVSYKRDLLIGFDTAELQQSIRATLDFGTQRLATSLSAEYLETGDRRTGGGERIGPSGYTSKALRGGRGLLICSFSSNPKLRESMNSSPVSARMNLHRQNFSSSRINGFLLTCNMIWIRRQDSTGNSTPRGNELSTIERRGILVLLNDGTSPIKAIFTG